MKPKSIIILIICILVLSACASKSPAALSTSTPAATQTVTLGPTKTATAVSFFVPIQELVKVSSSIGSSTESQTKSMLTGRIVYIVYDIVSGNRIFVMDADGSNVLDITPPNVTSVDHPSWSPDGKYIIFSARKDKNYIFKMRADGSDLVQLTSDDWWGSRPSWSPDGESILFVSSEPGVLDYRNIPIPQVYTMKSDGSEVQRLLVKTKADDTPMVGEFRGDGTISVSEIVTRYSYLTYIVDGNGEIQEQYLEFPSYEIPVWAPDGKSYLLPTNLRNSDACMGITFKTVDGFKNKCLTFGYRIDPPIFASNLSWSPDGQYIMFNANLDKKDFADIYRMRPDGTDLVQLVEVSTGMGYWKWTPFSE